MSVSDKFSSPFLPTGDKMDDTETGMLCPEMCSGPRQLRAPTEPGSSRAEGTGWSEVNTVLINSPFIGLILVLYTVLNYTLNY